jgi:regulatory protein
MGGAMGGDDRIVAKVVADSRRKGVYRIELDDGRTFDVHEDVLVRFRLVKGVRVSAALLDGVLEEARLQQAYRDALRFLGRAMRSAGEVRAKLEAKGHEPDVIDDVLKRLKGERLVDDEAFAETLARERLALGRKGRLWIRRELAARGVGKAEAERALASIDPRDEWEQAWRLASRRWPSIRGDLPARMHKAMNMLIRRGFPPDVARSVVLKLKSEHPVPEGSGEAGTADGPDGGRQDAPDAE